MIVHLLCFFRSVVECPDEEGVGGWEAYMLASKRPPYQEVQLQHTYADIRQESGTLCSLPFLLARKLPK